MRQERIGHYVDFYRFRINYFRKVVVTLEWDFDFSERMENLSYAIGYYRKK